MANGQSGSQTTAVALRESQDKDLSGSKEFIQYMAKHGVGQINEFLSDQLDAWKKMPIHVAVTGSSGAGKSSLINALRDLTGDDLGAAPVGVTETTTTMRHYVHPQNEQLKFWDLPGVGTKAFPRNSYLDKVKFARYDFFVIVSCTRFTEEDLWLAKEVDRLGKSFFFVHSKLDEDIENDLADNPGCRLPEDVKRKIRMDCHDQLGKAGFSHPNIFLISNYASTGHDFPRMTEKFFECLPKEKRDAWRLSMRALSEEAVREKRRALQGKVWMAATASAGAAAVPLPGIDIAVDLALLSNYQKYYIKQFKLDDEALQEMAVSSGKTVQELKSNIPQYTKLVQGGITALVKQFAKSATAESVAKFVPIIGSVVAASISFAVTCDTCEGEAIKLLKAVID